MHGGTGIIGRKRKTGRIVRQFFSPVRLQPRRVFAGEQLVLPGCVILVLNAQGRQGRGFSTRKRAVKSGKFADQDSHRPFIANNVMEIKQEQSTRLRQTEQVHTQQGTTPQVKRHRGAAQGKIARRLIGIFQSAKIMHSKIICRFVMDKLARFFPHHAERGSQRLMPPHDLIQRPSQRGFVERTVQPNRSRHVVGGGFLVHLVQDPQPLLSMREGIAVFAAFGLAKETALPQCLQGIRIAGAGALFQFFQGEHVATHSTIPFLPQ